MNVNEAVEAAKADADFLAGAMVTIKRKRELDLEYAALKQEQGEQLYAVLAKYLGHEPSEEEFALAHALLKPVIKDVIKDVLGPK